MSRPAARAPRLAEAGGCAMCGSPNGTVLFQNPDHWLGVPGRYSYRRCGRCATVYQDPRVVDEDLHLLYPGTYYTHDLPGSALPEPTSAGPPRRGIATRVRDGIREVVAPSGAASPGPLMRILARSRWLRERAFRDLAADELLPRRTPPGRALDVGCGGGPVMEKLGLLGWSVEGADPDPEACRAARQRTGRPVHHAGVEELDPALGPFDLIVLYHVFEHLPRPRAALLRLRELLGPDGRLVLIHPNPNAMLASRYGAAWWPWDAPRHLVLPTRGALVGLARACGLCARSVRTSAQGAEVNSALSRAIARGAHPVDPTVAPGPLDRVHHMVERVVVAAGADRGEDLVASFGRSSR